MWWAISNAWKRPTNSKFQFLDCITFCIHGKFRFLDCRPFLFIKKVSIFRLHNVLYSWKVSIFRLQSVLYSRKVMIFRLQSVCIHAKFRFLDCRPFVQREMGTHKGKRYEILQTQPSLRYEETSESLRLTSPEASRCRKAPTRVPGKWGISCTGVDVFPANLLGPD